MADNSSNQMMQIVQWLNEHGSITAYEAMTRLGIGRLSARIYDLRERGYNILTTYAQTEKSRYAVYIWEV